jgi:hypothetical protein
LISDEDALPTIREWVAASPLDVTILPASPEAGRRALEALQVTTRSPLGAVAFHLGGLLVDHGWLRVLGAGCEQLTRALDLWNTVDASRRCEDGLLIADDVLGGFFAWFREPQTVHYLAPDSLQWENSGLGYSEWLSWCLTERLEQYYAPFRWPGWALEVEALPASSALLVSPPLFAKGEAIERRQRNPVPVHELWHLAQECGRQLREVPDGAQFRLVVKP